jgi:hypothetical protein
MVTVIATLHKFYNTTKFFKNITTQIMLKNLLHHAGLKTSILETQSSAKEGLTVVS